MKGFTLEKNAFHRAEHMGCSHSSLVTVLLVQREASSHISSPWKMKIAGPVSLWRLY